MNYALVVTEEHRLFPPSTMVKSKTSMISKFKQNLFAYSKTGSPGLFQQFYSEVDLLQTAHKKL